MKLIATVLGEKRKHMAGQHNAADHGADHAQENQPCQCRLHDAQGRVAPPRHSLNPSEVQNMVRHGQCEHSHADPLVGCLAHKTVGHQKQQRDGHCGIDCDFYFENRFAQQVHILCAYWGFICMSLHLGFHWSMMLAMARKHLQPSSMRTWSLRLIGWFWAAYGTFAFRHRGVSLYLLLRSHFCDEFLSSQKIIFADGAFFTPDGRVTDDLPLRGEIYEELKCCAVNNIPRKITNILEVMKLAAHIGDFVPEADRIHLANGTLKLDGSFTEGRPNIVRSRLPVAYRPDAPAPVQWLSFLDGLLYAEDIPTLQEFIGYCLIPSNKGQRMMVIKGNGGEGKSQIGAVLGALLGSNMKDGSIGKISENRFARADLEHILLCVDDDMRMEALRQTNYVKSIVTAQGKMDLERKGKQSYQGWMFARLLAFSNGDLQALYDRSDGFYRRQLVLTAREKPAGRVDDPDLAEKLKAEVEGIFL